MEIKKNARVYDCWHSVMDAEKSPLKNISNTSVRHMILQLLAWMWCIVFSLGMGSYLVFGVSALFHGLFLAAIVITVGTFEAAQRKAPTNATKSQIYLTSLGK